MKKVRLAVIGCGNIFDAYVKLISQSKIIDIIACSDLENTKALEKSQKYSIGRICSLDEAVKMDDIDLILNITPPKAHADVTIKALEYGKNVFSEKPLATSYRETKKICMLAKKRGLLVGCAPDVFLGKHVQAIKKVLEERIIGEPFSASINMVCHGFEAYFEVPNYIYLDGAGPVFDMAVYHLSTAVYLLGPVKEVFSMHKKVFNKRTITAPGKKYGHSISVATPTHVMGILKFANGTLANINASYDVWESKLPQIEIHCTGGTICIADPDPIHGVNLYEDTVIIRKEKDAVWYKYPRDSKPKEWDKLIESEANHHRDYCRGMGVVDMAEAMIAGRKPAASMELAAHIVEIMCAMVDKNAGKRKFELESGHDF